jgi:hypothetical protein
MRKGIVLGVGNKLDQVEHALHNSSLKLVPTFIPQDAAEERQHASLLAGEFETECSDGLDDCDLELIGDLGHEACDLLHQSVHTGLVPGLEQRGDGKGRD